MDTALATIQQGRSPPSTEVDYGSWAQPDDVEGEYMPVDRLATMYRDYLLTKTLEIEEQKLSRRYYHGAQYTADDLRILRARHQPPVTYNRTARKINQISGLVQRVRQDPKAYPKKPNDENGAEIANMSIRATLDGSDWKTLEEFCIRQAAMDGISGIEIRLVEGDQGDPDIELHPVFADEYFYDPVSNMWDFSDARYDGIAKWIDVDEAIEMFPDKADMLNGLVENGSDLTTYADREFKWVLTRQRRIRLVEIWYRFKGRMCWAFFVGRTLIDQGASPFYDAKNRQISRFVMFSCAVDQDGDRYSFVRNLKGPQDEINQRRGKALYISNSRRIIADKGAVDDVERARREWARPDGWIEKNPNKEMTPDNTTQDLAAQVEWLREAKDEIEQFASVNPMAMSRDVSPNMSGKAVNLLQAPGLAEIGPFVTAVRGFKLRVYRGTWCAQQRLWKNERWVRVTGEEKKQVFLQINGMELDQWGRPQMVNAVGALDVDIHIDEGPDEPTLMMDAWDVIKGIPNVPPAALIELAPLPQSKKDKFLKALQQQPDPIEAATKQAVVQGINAENRKTEAETVTEHTKAINQLATAAMNATKAGLPSQAVYAQGEDFAPIPDGGITNPQQAGRGAGPVAAPLGAQPAGPGSPPPAPGPGCSSSGSTPRAGRRGRRRRRAASRRGSCCGRRRRTARTPGES